MANPQLKAWGDRQYAFLGDKYAKAGVFIA